MHLHDYLAWPGPVTARQHEAWRAWLGEQWNRPSRADHYAMAASGGRTVEQPLVFRTAGERAAAEAAEVRMNQEQRRASSNVHVVTKTRAEIERDGPDAELRRRGAELAARRATEGK